MDANTCTNSEDFKIQLKSEAVLWGLTDRQLEINHGGFILYMTTVARLLYAQKRRGLTLSTMEEGLVKMMELAEKSPMTSLIKEMTISTFMTDWKPPYRLFA